MTLHICCCTGCDAHQGSCPNPVERGRCQRCSREAAKRRGTTTEQGLGWQHQQQRATLIRQAIGTMCPTCPEAGRQTLMTDVKLMVADHAKPRSSGNRAPADRVHCRRCSDEQGGRLSRQAQS